MKSTGAPTDERGGCSLEETETAASASASQTHFDAGPGSIKQISALTFGFPSSVVASQQQHQQQRQRGRGIGIGIDSRLPALFSARSAAVVAIAIAATHKPRLQLQRVCLIPPPEEPI
ncbi:hypothetical protein PaG_03290 [Moesziomyces aphidis]|uniref:Uncharacterized protein n=1 Tax=Moesziomyces aphidis TaxID=84754 RepID=W3VPD7_MOEAP|nr:hypothetical protein PaG_03290 [Moesziomyces aphidis]